MKHELAGVEAYPLAWPLGWARAKLPRKAPYRYTLEKSLFELQAELRMMGAQSCVLSSNVPSRRDGWPRSGLSEPDDRGVAVYWLDRDNRARVMACDAWNTVRGNVRAIGLAIAALRMIDRTGASQLLERAFTGFAALPAQAGRPWRAVLGLNGGPITAEQLTAAYRAAAASAHPDRGGTHDAMTEVNSAYAQARTELGGAP
jgi:hypothetical protein